MGKGVYGREWRGVTLLGGSLHVGELLGGLAGMGTSGRVAIDQ